VPGDRSDAWHDVAVLKQERDVRLDVFDRGCLVLRRDGEIAGHVATTLGTFWSPGRPLTMQQCVWFVVVWADGEKEPAVEDYPPWTYVHEIREGRFDWPDGGPRSGEYGAEWLPWEEREAHWAALGVTLDDF
jgi:hypothetical protein